MKIREANVEDAPAASALVRDSITRLCRADHLDDPKLIADWLANKTAENFAAWISEPGNLVVVAERGARLAGVGAVRGEGEITLLYVAPDARFQGVSKALLRELEGRAIEYGCQRCTLTSTKTASQFYLSAGYLRTDGAEDGNSLVKLLITAAADDPCDR